MSKNANMKTQLNKYMLLLDGFNKENKFVLKSNSDEFINDEGFNEIN